MRWRLSALLFCLLSLSFGLKAQQVWPGDINNNGLVNVVDVLYWGLAQGSTGPARSQTGTIWQDYAAPSPWSQSFVGGLNYYYADCNGDGTIDDDDLDDAIEANYNQAHGPFLGDNFVNASPGLSPRIVLEPSATVVTEGAMVNIALKIDDSASPIDDFYGIAFTMTYTTGLIEGDDGPDFDLEETSWLGGEEDEVESLFHETDNQGDAALAITRTDQISVPVSSESIGNISVVIEDIIVGLYIDTLKIEIDSVLLITDDMISIPVTPDSVSIIVARDTKLVTSTEDDLILDQTLETLEVFPNPAYSEFYIKTDVPLHNPTLVDYLGRVHPIRFQQLADGLYRFQNPSLPPGLYLLQLSSRDKTIIRKVVFSP